MRASVGDHIVVVRRGDGRLSGACEVLRLIGPDGRPPYLVRWLEDGDVSEFFPGANAYVDHYREAS